MAKSLQFDAGALTPVLWNRSIFRLLRLRLQLQLRPLSPYIFEKILTTWSRSRPAQKFRFQLQQKVVVPPAPAPAPSPTPQHCNWIITDFQMNKTYGAYFLEYVQAFQRKISFTASVAWYIMEAKFIVNNCSVVLLIFIPLAMCKLISSTHVRVYRELKTVVHLL
jgi:hypothetical protein